MRMNTLFLVSTFLVLLSTPIGISAFAFVGTSRLTQIIHKQQPSNHSKPRVGTILQSKRTVGDTPSKNATPQNIFYSSLSTDRDQSPNQGTFFYNDEVSSHLYGYVYLVGLFAAQDSLFLGTFFVLSSASAWATQESMLPCNPRIPALTAGLTLGVTVLARYGLGLEPDLQGLLPDYQGPSEAAFRFEAVITTLNILWGFFGTWRTKEQVNGATYGF